MCVPIFKPGSRNCTIGAEPALTGYDVFEHVLPFARPPLPFETNIPGVFAVGDVRHGSTKRVAGAAGKHREETDKLPGNTSDHSVARS